MTSSQNPHAQALLRSAHQQALNIARVKDPRAKAAQIRSMLGTLIQGMKHA